MGLSQHTKTLARILVARANTTLRALVADGGRALSLPRCLEASARVLQPLVPVAGTAAASMTSTSELNRYTGLVTPAIST